MSLHRWFSWPRWGHLLSSTLMVAAPLTLAKAGESPHGVREGCAACHAPALGSSDSESPAVGPLRQPVVGLCRSCHPDADMHVVDIAPVATRVPEDWPLEMGRITCATCHAEPGHASLAGQAHLAQLPPPYHRGGPYADASELCFQCHTRTEYVRQDPHHPQDENTCSACHIARPLQGARPEESRLRLAGSALCMGCHTGPPHQGALPHLGQRLGHERALGLAGNLALDEGKVACFTCHDVHTAPAPVPPANGAMVAGLRAVAREDRGASGWSGLPEKGLLWPGEGRKEHPPMLARPLGGPPGETLCGACHGVGPDRGEARAEPVRGSAP